MVLFDFSGFLVVVVLHPISGSFCLVPSVRVVVPEVVQHFIVVVSSHSSLLGLDPDGRLSLLFKTPLTQDYRLEECLAANPDVGK